MLKIIIVITLFSFSSLTNLSAESNKEYWCNRYAQDAVEQHEINIKYSCGFKTSRWSNDKEGQKKWCLAVNESTYRNENNTRASMLDQCYKEFATVTNKKNQIPLPRECRDYKSKYVPIYSFYDSHRHRDKIRTPVSNGLIKHDFNNDNNEDLLFIEENDKKNIRVVACISSTDKGFMKVNTNISFSYGDRYVSGYSYHISAEKGLIGAATAYTAHNEGSSSSISYYKFDNKKKSFVFVESTSDVEPVYYDFGNGLEPYSFSAPPPL